MKIFKKYQILVFIVSCFLITEIYAKDRNENITLYTQGIELLNNGSYRESISCFNKVIKDYPNFSQAYIFKARALNRTHQYKESIIIIDEMLKIRNKKYDVELKSEGFLTKAHALYNLGRYKESLKYANSSLSCSKTPTLPLYIRASTYGALGYFELSINDFDKILELEPNNKKNDKTYLNRFCPLYKLKRYDEALATCNKALEITKDASKLPQIYSKKALVLNKLGKYQEALESAKKSLQINNKDPLGISEKRVAESNLKKKGC